MAFQRESVCERKRTRTNGCKHKHQEVRKEAESMGTEVLGGRMLAYLCEVDAPLAGPKA